MKIFIMELAKFNGVNIKRQSNFELLRVLAMIMIVAHHYVLNGSLEYSSLTLNSSILKFVSIGGKIGVDIFAVSYTHLTLPTNSRV